MIETEVMTNRFIGDGSNKAFPFSFRFNKGDDIQVWLYDDTTGEITQRSDFTLSPNDSTYPSNGGVVTFPSSGNAITANQMVIIQRHMDIFQLDPYKHGEFLQLDNFEKSLDTIVMEVQQVAEAAGRSIKYPLNQTDFDPTLPPLKDGQTIMVNDDENGWTVIDVKELFDQTHSAWVAASNAAESASVSQKWAESEESPDNQLDEDSDTGRTQSSKSWMLDAKEQALLSTGQADLAKAWAQGSSSPDGNADEESTTGETQSSRNWALFSKDWAQGTTSPDNKDDVDSNTGKTQSAKEWTLDAKDWAQSESSPDNKNDDDSETTKTMSSKSWALHSRERAAAALSSENNAKTSEINAKESETNAKQSELNAAESESNASESETNAADSAELADAWAQSSSSPDGNNDTSSPTGKTMSSRSWVLYVKELIGESGITTFTGATESNNGEQGLVPAPLAGQQEHVLKGDGTWGELNIANKTSNGLAPMLGTYIEEPLDDPMGYSDLIYLDGSDNQAKWSKIAYLGKNSDGVVKHFEETPETGSPEDNYLNAKGQFSKIEMPSVFTGATNIKNGTSGVVPAPTSGQENSVLMGDGTWKALFDLIHPVGQILAFNNNADPNTIFPGTTWEAFAKGRTLVGAGTSDISFELGNSGGASNVTLTTAQMPSHTHSATSSSVSGSGGFNTYTWNNGSVYGVFSSIILSGSVRNDGDGNYTNIMLNINSAISTSISNTGNNKSHNNLQPYIVVNYWVRTQ